MESKWIFLTTTAFLVLFIQNTLGFSKGAPDNPEICKSMTPGHSNTSPNRGATPFTVEVNHEEVLGGDEVVVVLQGNDRAKFKGFLIMAHKLDKSGVLQETGIPIGKFTHDDKARHVNCGGIQGGAVTHVSSTPKQELRVNWQAPNEEGEYKILATFVQDYNTYWVKVPSQKIRVKKDSQSEDGQDNAKPSTGDLDPKTKDLMRKYGSDCGKTKSCFALPEGCEKKDVSTCEMFTSFRPEGQRFVFQIFGNLRSMAKDTGHVSVGLSFDKSMGQDSVTGCVLQDNHFKVKSYYNFPNPTKEISKNQNSIMEDEEAGLDQTFNTEGEYTGGVLFCEFARTPLLKNTPNELQKEFNLAKDSYYILLARSYEIKIGTNGREKLGYHYKDTDRGSSSHPFSLAKIEQLKDTTTGGKKGSANLSSIPNLFVLISVFLLNAIF